MYKNVNLASNGNRTEDRVGEDHVGGFEEVGARGVLGDGEENHTNARIIRFECVESSDLLLNAAKEGKTRGERMIVREWKAGRL